MKRTSILSFTVACGLFAVSCTGVKNMSGTLSKSDGREYSSEKKHGDYLNSTPSTDSVRTYQTPSRVNASERENTSNDTYRRDYGRLTDTKSETQPAGSTITGNSDFNQKLVNQYAEMDKLGELVLYELDITEKRYAKLLDQFRTANNNDRDAISKELDKLNADQLVLYKTYTNIYKFGKSDWVKVKGDVETTLMNLRGIDRK